MEKKAIIFKVSAYTIAKNNPKQYFHKNATNILHFKINKIV